MARPTGGCPPAFDATAVSTALSSWAWWKGLWDTEAALAYLTWYAYVVVAWLLLPGEWIEGTVMRDGRRKKYKINAFPTALLALGIAVGIVYQKGPEPLTFVYTHWVGLLTASTIMSLVQAFVCYVASFREGALLALGGNTGSHIYDFFIGRELNPSIGSFDLKSFNEIRPGLIFWIVLNIGVPALLTTMDITTDGFGFMLACAITWVPFTYTVQARYLVFNQVELGPVYTALIIGVNLLGYYIFRTANGEKNDFRNGKNPKNLQYMTTESGRVTCLWLSRGRFQRGSIRP
ncbi:hypothetical protein GSI_15302 [Ganoderma sinense ZZ0214-1]|uniref:Uncharacterized protein n=1 Tax=Ganoderma sinense ZZ0214-1 TaxID=1077348 RepID=A0A2G8RM78_9APHY|nr:hypothetical protein GSI_15302 [Ganoderma sinense ZZ0214-1]